MHKKASELSVIKQYMYVHVLLYTYICIFEEMHTCRKMVFLLWWHSV